MLLEDWPSGVEFVFIDDDWGRGGKNDWLIAPEESAKRQRSRKRGVDSKASNGHQRRYVRLALNAHSAYKLILDTSL